MIRLSLKSSFQSNFQIIFRYLPINKLTLFFLSITVSIITIKRKKLQIEIRLRLIKKLK